MERKMRPPAPPNTASAKGDAPNRHPGEWPLPRRISFLTRLRSWWAWREVMDQGVWVYFENDITGERKAVDKGGPWQPVDYMWLAERSGRSIRRDGEVTYF